MGSDIFEEKRVIDSISMNLVALPSFNIPTANLPFKKKIHLSFWGSLHIRKENTIMK